ncbi:hypothetical protein D6745_03380 [Candidatus Woesearchaeota archaeon]|nr:MAG: hypothetical protein D6745_03380 [Candidatus Woesearchaeota archaeon]
MFFWSIVKNPIKYDCFFYIMNSLVIPHLTDNPPINLALDTLKKKKQALVFVNTKRGAEKLAEDISKKISSSDKILLKISDEILGALPTPTKQCERLARCVKKGIAYHHSGLVAKQRELIEENFRKGVIKIICCTPTLAFGVDLPAFRSIIRDVHRYGGRWGMQDIPVLEYMQQAGRAGRPNFDSYGEAILIAKTDAEKEKLVEKYIRGKPENIFSKLAADPILRTCVLSLIVTGIVKDKNSLVTFLEKTFWAHQFKDMEKIKLIVEKVLGQLEEYEFIKSAAKEDFVSADSLGSETLRPTLLGKRVSELYLDPVTAFQIITGLRKASSKGLYDFPLLHLITNTLEMRPMLRARAAEYDELQEKLAEYDEQLLVREPSMYDVEYEEFINSIKTALMFYEWVNEKDEEFLLEKYSIRPGELRAKLEIADWLLFAADELAMLLHFHHLRNEIKKMRFRVKYGAKEELFALLKLRGIGRVRARILYNNRIRSVSDVKKADLTRLAQLLGRKIALSIKKQVGQDFEKIKVKEKKRKGQVSLKDYPKDHKVK